jgi:YVTN family beta-propeller protein
MFNMGKYIMSKHKLYWIALGSVSMILMLMNIVSAYPYGYIANYGSSTVSVIDIATNKVTATVNVGGLPYGVAVTGKYLYVTNEGNNNISVIETTTNNAAATVNAGTMPLGIAISPDGTKLYVANYGSNDVYVIDTATKAVISKITVEDNPWGIVISPDGTKVYVTNYGSNTVSVLSTATNSIIATVNVGSNPTGVTATSDGTKVYVTNNGSNTVSVIDTATNTVTATVNVGRYPYALGQFIGKSAPIITWNQPADSRYGTILNNIQLNATASVPGTFVYNPSSGTITLKVTFIPKDDVNYLQTSAVVPINITTTTPVLEIIT